MNSASPLAFTAVLQTNSASQAQTPSPESAVLRLDNSVRILSSQRVVLDPKYAANTDIFPETPTAWWEKVLTAVRMTETARRSKQLRRSIALFRASGSYSAVITVGDLEGLALGMWRALFRRPYPVNMMYDCLWYGGSWLKKAWVRYCLQSVDVCVVWSSVERSRYAAAYKVPENKFVFVPHHHTMKNYSVEVSDGDYVFAGGNADRDYRIFADAVRGLDIPCVIATNRPENLQGFTLPATVKAVSVSPAEFRQLMAGARIVVIPMRTGYLHAGGQQSVLNAMSMGKPVIFTDEEGGADYVSDWRTGILVPYRSVGKLRSAIRSLWQDPVMARLIGDCARNFAAPLSTQRCNDAIWKLCVEKIPPQTIAVEKLARVYSQGL